eukprot:IDg3196t1
MEEVTSHPAEDNAKGDTVKQTIVETVEAPRLTDVATSDFVTFKMRRQTYERVISEKNYDPLVNIPLTTYKSSISKHVQQLFVLANWVSASNLDDITEEQLKACVAALRPSAQSTMISRFLTGNSKRSRSRESLGQPA